MSLGFNTNIAASIAHRNLSTANQSMTKSLDKLTSGSRVSSARDDAASMAIGSRIKAELAAFSQVQTNTSQAISMLQIAEGAMGRVYDIMVRSKALASQAGSGNLSDVERAMLNTEYQALMTEIDRLAADTKFTGSTMVNQSMGVATAGNISTDEAWSDTAAIGMLNIAAGGSLGSGNIALHYNNVVGAQWFRAIVGVQTLEGSIDQSLFTGNTLVTGTSVRLSEVSSAGGSLAPSSDAYMIITLSSSFALANTNTSGSLALSGTSYQSFNFKVGTDGILAEDTMSVRVQGVNTASLGLANSNIATIARADASSSSISHAIDILLNGRALIGAGQSSMEAAADNISITMQNLDSARSAYLDLDVAQEMSAFVSKQILVEAGVAMMAQATQLPRQLLALFQ